MYLNADCLGADRLRYLLILGRSGQRQAHRIHGARTEQVGAAKREPVGFVIPVIVSAQDVLIGRWEQIIFSRKQIASEQGMLVACLIVDLDDCLALVDGVPFAICNFAARIVRLRKNRGEFDGCRAEQCRIDAVVHKWSPERDGASRIASRRGKCGKVAGKHCGRGNETTRVRWILPNRRALITAEEEECVGEWGGGGGGGGVITLQGTVPFFARPRI